MNKTENTIFSITLVIAVFVTPFLFSSWKQEKERAELYKKEFFLLWNQLELIDKGELTSGEALELLNEKKEFYDLMMRIAEENHL